MKTTHPMDTHHLDTAKGLGALALNAVALLTSAQEHLEWGLRCLSLFGGFIVAVVTVWNILRTKRTRE